MRIPSKLLKAILLAAGKKDIRYYLNGIHINPRHIVATDGNRLHAYSHGQEWQHGDVTIPRDAVEMALKARTVDIEITDTSVGAVSYKPLDGRYPDYMRVIPAVAQLAPISGERHVAAIPADQLKDAFEFVKAVGYPDTVGPCLSRIGDAWTWQSVGAAVVVMALRPTVKQPVLTSLERFQ